MDHEALGVADVGEVREQLHRLDEGPPCLAAAFHAEAEDGARTFRQQGFCTLVVGVGRKLGIAHP